jgi:hypothetical protein
VSENIVLRRISGGKREEGKSRKRRKMNILELHNL